MAKIIVFQRAIANQQLVGFLKMKLLRPYWQRVGWEYEVEAHSSGETFFFTRKGLGFDGKYAKIEPEAPNVIEVFDQAAVKPIKNLLKDYDGGLVLIEIM